MTPSTSALSHSSFQSILLATEITENTETSLGRSCGRG